MLEGAVYSYLQIKAERKTPYPVMPDGTQAVYISSNGSMIGGTQLEAIDVQLLEPGEYFGIWFYPGALRHFFKINLSEITGKFTDSKYFECSRFSQLHNELYTLKGFSKRADFYEHWLLRRYARNDSPNLERALSLIYQSAGRERVESIASKVGWSSRHLNRQFLQHVGVSIKAFSQIVRAQQVCKQVFVLPLGLKCKSFDPGYYDQPHLINDFNKHFKLPPGELFSRFMSDSYNL